MLFDKEQVATRQLDNAIRLLFSAGDIVSVHTLAYAAASVYANLLNQRGQQSWRDRLIKCYPGQEREIRNVLGKSANFFKHADNDPEDILEFDENNNDETIIVATLEYGELLRGTGRKITRPMGIFQCWYFAKDPRLLEVEPTSQSDEIVAKCHRLFPDLGSQARFEQLAFGAEVLREWEKK